MSLPSLFLINSFSCFCLLLIKSSTTDLECFQPFNKQESLEVKLKSTTGVELNYSLLSFKIC